MCFDRSYLEAICISRGTILTLSCVCVLCWVVASCQQPTTIPSQNDLSINKVFFFIEIPPPPPSVNINTLGQNNLTDKDHQEDSTK